MRAMCVRKLKLSYDEIFGLHFSYVCYAFYVVISPFLRIFSCCRRVRRRLSLLLPLAVIHTEFGHFLCDTATRFDDFFSSSFCYRIKSNNDDDDDEQNQPNERKRENSPIQRH